MTDVELDPTRTAIVAVDLQIGVVGLETRPHSANRVIDNCVALLRAGRRVGARAVLVHVGASADGADWPRPVSDAPARRGAMPADFSTLIPEVEQQPGDLVVFKRQWGAFYGTDLDLQLRRRGLDTLVMCGIATEFGVESTARDAYERGYRQVLVSDAMSGLSDQSHSNAIERIFPRIGQVRTTEQVLSALEH